MAIFVNYGGAMLSVDEAPRVLEGEWSFTRTVLIGFESVTGAELWFFSPEYQNLARHRHAAAESHCVIVNGMET
jgi:uncharacterized protein (DUF1330 family)